jgi:signal transduction histidine kinase
VRNPLFGISSTLDAFEARAGGDAVVYLKNMREQVARLGDLMTELLDYGRPISGELTSEPLSAVIAEAVESCAPRSAEGVVALELEPGIDSMRVPMERARMRRVFQNLVQNAVDHTPRGGRVVVRVQREAWEGRTGARCTVRDYGPGFVPADLPRVFEPFFTRRRGGTGLGLSIVQRIVEQHAGRVSAENHPGGGGLVTVWLPEATD